MTMMLSPKVIELPCACARCGGEAKQILVLTYDEKDEDDLEMRALIHQTGARSSITDEDHITLTLCPGCMEALLVACLPQEALN